MTGAITTLSETPQFIRKTKLPAALGIGVFVLFNHLEHQKLKNKLFLCFELKKIFR